jgi:hypothetical protein
MVEPEILMDGEHDIDVCYDVTSAFSVRIAVQAERPARGTILKASMVISGKVAWAGQCRRGRQNDRALLKSAYRPRCRASCSCPAARATSRRRRI